MSHPPALYDPPEQLNLADYFLADRLREGHGDRIALHLVEGNTHSAQSYAEVEARAARFAVALRAAGVRQEERVIVALPDGADFVAAIFGILKLGAVVVMLNPDLSREEIEAQLAYVRPSLAVVSPKGFELYTGVPQQLVNGLLVAGSPDHPAAWQKRAPDELSFPAVATHRDDPAIWLFSGGTTGRPKAVVQPHRSFANTTELYAKNTLRYAASDITLSVPKLYFGYATGSNLFFPFAAGAASVLFPEPPTPELLFRLIARFSPTVMINVPTMLQRMVDFPGAADQDLSSLRCITSAGEALPPSLYHRFYQLFGVELLDGLGTAEMWHIFVTNRPGEVHPGKLGRAVEGFEISARDEDGRILPAGEVGRLWVRGGSRAHHYWQNQEKSQEAFRGEYFAAGDLIEIDESGIVTYCGRADDVLKVAGRWLVPAEVEDVLLRHPAVAECAVLGAPDATGLIKPFAFVRAKEDAPADLEELLKALTLDQLAAYKHPRRVFVLTEFPRTHLGKIDRGALRARLPELL